MNDNEKMREFVEEFFAAGKHEGQPVASPPASITVSEARALLQMPDLDAADANEKIVAAVDFALESDLASILAALEIAAESLQPAQQASALRAARRLQLPENAVEPEDESIEDTLADTLPQAVSYLILRKERPAALALQIALSDAGKPAYELEAARNVAALFLQPLDPPESFRYLAHTFFWRAVKAASQTRRPEAVSDYARFLGLTGEGEVGAQILEAEIKDGFPVHYRQLGKIYEKLDLESTQDDGRAQNAYWRGMAVGGTVGKGCQTALADMLRSEGLKEEADRVARMPMPMSYAIETGRQPAPQRFNMAVPETGTSLT